MLSLPLTVLLVLYNPVAAAPVPVFQPVDSPATAQEAPASLRVPVLRAIPPPLHWKNQPVDWKLTAAGELTIVSGRKTNWFVNPLRGSVEDNLPLLLFKPSEEFILTAKVKVGFKASWDAGGLVVRASDELWGKFCLELSVKKEPMVVSVVTRTSSDDCNSMVVPDDEVYYRLAKVGPAIFSTLPKMDGSGA